LPSPSDESQNGSNDDILRLSLLPDDEDEDEDKDEDGEDEDEEKEDDDDEMAEGMTIVAKRSFVYDDFPNTYQFLLLSPVKLVSPKTMKTKSQANAQRIRRRKRARLHPRRVIRARERSLLLKSQSQ